jgi:hypothetical protein
MGGMRNLYIILVGIREGKRPLGRRKRRRGDNIDIYREDLNNESVEWIHLAQDRDKWRALVKTEMNLQVP